MLKAYNIQIVEEELHLLNRALELYGRVGLLQFEHLDMCYSLQKLIWDKDLQEEFKTKADELKALFGYVSNANPGIFNKEHVQDDARIALHIHQQIRHELYLNDEDENKPKYTVDAYPADVCQIAGIETPKFKIEKDG